MLLAIDVGNTQTQFGVFDSAGVLISDWRLSTHREQTADDLGGHMRSLLQLEGIDAKAINGMVAASGVAARLRFDDIPFMDGVFGLIESGIAPGGSHRNLSSAEGYTTWSDGLYEHAPILLADAQTSGGLLISVASEKAAELVSELEISGVQPRAVIGNIVDRTELNDGVLIQVEA